MNINNSTAPEDLMNKVENKLKKHVQQKNRRKKIYSATFAIILALILPTSVLAYNSRVKTVPFKQEIDLAREHKDTYKIDKTFKYKNIEFKFKEIIADETGILVIYDVSNPEYYISSLSLKDKNNAWLGDYGYSLPGTLDSQTERTFHISASKDVVQYMKDSPITIKIDKIDHLENTKKSLLTKLKDIVKKDKNLAVDWTLKTQLPLQPMKTFKLNKEIVFDIGTLKFTAFREGVLRSYVNYEFIPSDKNITNFDPVFSIRIDNGSYKKDLFDSIPMENSIELKSTYYNKPKEIGVKLIGATVSYSNKNNKEYTISKSSLPTEYEFSGDKFKLLSAKETGDSMEYSFEFDKTNKSFTNLSISLGDCTESESYKDKVQFKDQAKRDEIYNALTSKTPEIKNLYSDNLLDKGIVRATLKIKDKAPDKFTISSYEKTYLYNLDEYIIKTEALK